MLEQLTTFEEMKGLSCSVRMLRVTLTCTLKRLPRVPFEFV